MKLPGPTPSARPRETVTRLREHASDISRFLASTSIINGKLLASVELDTSFSEVAHGLGRVPIGAFVVNATQPATIARSYDVENPALVLKLKASSAATFDIWVF